MTDDSAHSHPWKISDVVLFPILGLTILAEVFWPTVVFGFPTWWAIVAGVVLFVGGFRLIAAAKAALDGAGQPSLPGEPTTQVVTGGPFRYSRNPNYLGAIGVAVGLALIVDSWWFLGGAVLGAVILDRWMIAPEERYLRAKFGAAYEEYAGRVRRWI